MAVAGFMLSAAAIAVFGYRLAYVVDRLADRTGLGEAVAGAVLLAGANSIAGLVVSVVAAAGGDASLAVSNSTGGIAAQTAFIVAADLVYRRANIEHAAASLTNVFYSFLMIILLGIVLAGVASPPFTVLGVHPVSPLLLVTYLYGLYLSRQVGEEPMWEPKATLETRPDEPRPESMRESLPSLWARFVALGLIVTAAGYVVARAGLSIIALTGLSGTFVGGFLTSIITSLPELVTAVAAVRAGALTLAVGGIIGGNTFDVLFIAAGDAVFRDGSIYEAVTQADVFVVGWTMLLVGIAGAGLVYRQRRGIGFEGYAIVALYLAGLAVVSTM
jgi:cation:H+ antiporter